jgi:transposase
MKGKMMPESTCPKCGKECNYRIIKATKVYDIVNGKKCFIEYTQSGKMYECWCGVTWRV